MNRTRQVPRRRALALIGVTLALTLAACGTETQEAAVVTTAPATAAPTTAPTTTASTAPTTAATTTAPTPPTTAPLPIQAVADLLAAHDDGTEFVGAVVGIGDATGATAITTAGRISLAGADPVDPDVAWNIGSVTKVFVAVVALQLVDEGALDLDSGIDPWFPALDDAPAITPRMLLRHTSGLAEYLDLAAQEPARRWEPAELIALAETRGRVGAPGAGYAYSNANYIALGEIIEQVTGNSWDEEVRRRIVEPLGLTGTQLVNATGRVPGHALVDGAWVDVAGSADPSIGGAAGALESTVADLLRFAGALAGGSLVSAELRSEMETFAPAEDYSAFGVEHSYGLGLERYETAGVTVLGHLGVGDAAGHSAFVGFDPDRGNIVTVQFNTAVPGPQAVLAIEILEALAADGVSAG